jgi:hypothetical protein
MLPSGLQEDVLASIDCLIWVVFHILYEKLPTDGLDEVHIGSSPSFEAEVAYCCRPDQVSQSLLQERERRLEVDTIRCDNDVWRRGWNACRTGLAPVVDASGHPLLHVIELNVALHQGKHCFLICDV